MVFIFFSACQVEVSNSQELVNLDSEFIKVGIKPVSVDTLMGADFYFSQLLYRSQLLEDEIALTDSKFCRVNLLKLSTGQSKLYEQSTFPQFEDCLHSVSKNKDTAFFYYSHPLKEIIILNDSIYSIKSFINEDINIHASHDLPIQKLDNGNVLVPTAMNISHNASYAKENMDVSNIQGFMNNQYLFALFSSTGELIVQFGKFPTIYLVENLKQNSHRSYHYSVVKDKIYVAFAQTAEVQIYDLDGQLLKTLHFKLPEFEELNTKNPDGGPYNAIDGFAVEERAERVNYYFKTIHPKKREQYLVKIDLVKQMTEYTAVSTPLGMMMSQVKDGQWMHLNMPWDDEPLLLKTFQF